jgi:pimeloyl-ACP methyl ester carboxylesterase
MRDVLVKAVQESYEEDLSRIACPVTLVWGDDDTESPLTVARTAADLLSNSKLTVCQNAGHLTPKSVPGELRAAVEGILF